MFIIKDKLNVSNKICYACESDNVEVDHMLTELGGPPEWDPVSYFVPVLKCNDCNTVIPQKEEKKVKNLAIQKASGLLSPKEIKEIRNKLSWGKRGDTFSINMRWGSSTVPRWETKAYVQSSVYDDVLRLIDESIKYGKVDVVKYFESKIPKENKKEQDIDIIKNKDEYKEKDHFINLKNSGFLSSKINASKQFNLIDQVIH